MRHDRKNAWRGLTPVVVLAGSLVAMAGIAVAAGSINSQTAGVPAVVTNARGWQAVADGSSGTLIYVGWVDPSRPAVLVTLTNSALPRETASVGLQLVLDDSGRPIGLLGPNGFVRGGVRPDGSVTPDMVASLETTAQVHSVLPQGAPPRRTAP